MFRERGEVGSSVDLLTNEKDELLLPASLLNSGKEENDTSDVGSEIR